MEDKESITIRKAVINQAINYISPADYRRSSEQMVEDSSFSHGMTLDDLDDAGSKITVEYLATFTVLYERKKGNYHNMSDEWCDFIEKYRYLATKDTLYIDCTIDDPSYR